MPDANTSTQAPGASFLPTRVLLPLSAMLLVLFVLLLFPWDSLGRRIAWEISRVSGARVEVTDLGPALSARGPVMRARDVDIQHPAIERVRLGTLEIAPRLAASWLSGNPKLRIWADTELGVLDGVLSLGPEPAYLGRVRNVELTRLPLRLDPSQLHLAGRLSADADVALAPNGTLSGELHFDSSALEVETERLPIAIPFSRATGTVEILPSGDTRISGIELEGPMIEGHIEGKIGLVHRSQSPPIDLAATLRIHDPVLLDMAQSNGFPITNGNQTNFDLSGTVASPQVLPRRTGLPR